MSSKYSDQRLKELALGFLYLDGGGDRRADMTLMLIQQFTGLNHNQIREKIRELARYESKEN